MNYKDYYAILGVPKTASQDEIRKAFRKLARQYHPDVAKDKKTAEAKFKEINEAYEVLGDAEKRRKYDELGANWEHGGAQPRSQWRRGAQAQDPFGGFSFGGTGFSDFFEQFFGQAAQWRDGRPGRGGMGFEPGGAGHAGADIEADLLVTIEDALHGAKKKITLRRPGESTTETYEIRIPKGVREGQRIRLAGQGSKVGPHGRGGDLFLRVRFAQHPDYQIDGADLIYSLEIPVWKAVLGSQVEVPSPEGNVRLKIPAGSQPGQRFRLKGRGLPTAQGGRGDYYVKLEVTLPTELSAKQRSLWEELSREG